MAREHWWPFARRYGNGDRSSSRKSRAAIGSPIDYFSSYEAEDRNRDTRARVLRAISNAETSARRAGKGTTWYVPKDEKRVGYNPAYIYQGTGVADVDGWLATKASTRRQDRARQSGYSYKNGAKAASVGTGSGRVEVKENRYGRMDVAKLYEAAEQVSRDNQRRSEISSLLKRLGVKNSKFRSFGGNDGKTGASAITQDELNQVAKEARAAFGRLRSVSRLDPNAYKMFDGALTWEEKKASDRARANDLSRQAKGQGDGGAGELPKDTPPSSADGDRRTWRPESRTDRASGFHGTWVGTRSSGGWDRGRPIAMGPDGQPIFASTERSPVATNMKSAWQWAEFRNRQKETHDKVAWQMSEEGLDAQQQQRINTAVARYNRMLGRRVEVGLRAMLELSKLGVDLSGQVTDVPEEPRVAPVRREPDDELVGDA